MRRFTWTSSSSLTASTGTEKVVPREGGGQFGLISANVDVGNEPSGGNLELDILVDGASVFSEGYLTILDGESQSVPKVVDGRIYFSPGSILSVQIVTVSGATGPIVVQFDYLPGA